MTSTRSWFRRSRDGRFSQIIPIKDKRKIIDCRTSPPGRSTTSLMRSRPSLPVPSTRQRYWWWTATEPSSLVEGYEAESGYVFEGRSGSYRDVFKNRYLERVTSGIGWMYDVVSAALGFVNTHIGYLADPGKTMGLAPYGKLADALSAPWIHSEGFVLDLSGFNDWTRGLGDRQDRPLRGPDASPDSGRDPHPSIRDGSGLQGCRPNSNARSFRCASSFTERPARRTCAWPAASLSIRSQMV